MKYQGGYVRRDAVLKKIYDRRISFPANDFEFGYETALSELKQEVDELRPSSLRRQTPAEWVWNPDKLGYECSRCGTVNENLHRTKIGDVTVWPGSHFCPECGAANTQRKGNKR